MARRERNFQLEARQQFLRVAGIFGTDDIGVAQGFQQARRYIV
jgi:hypothetical protein